MVKNAILTVNENGIENTINIFLKNILEKGIVQALLVPVEIKGKISTALVSKSKMLDSARPLAQVMSASTARMLSNITRISPPANGKKIGVVIRSCELRAFIELVKLKQASPENLLIIGVDCYGTLSADKYEDLCKVAPQTFESITEIDSNIFREACQICEYPAPLNADLAIGTFGMEKSGKILVLAMSSAGETALTALDTQPADNTDINNREAAIKDIKVKKTSSKTELLEKYSSGLSGLDNLQSIFASCINCHNCRVACPICYCRECFFDSPTFEWKADNYLDWSQKRGTLAMPNDRLLFHLTRLNHMVTSCVGCGLCQEACPNDIPVFSIFRLVGDKVQASFEYVPGQSLEDKLPVSEFRENELDELGK